MNPKRFKVQTLKKYADKQTQCLADHPRAKVKTAQKRIEAKIHQLCIQSWCQIQEENGRFIIVENQQKKDKISRLDGCYVLKTDIAIVSAEIIHDRYKDLALVEQAFRTMKTVILEARPIYVRSASSTRGHVLVVMLAYLLAWQLRKYWKKLDCTIAEGLEQLTTLCSIKVGFKNKTETCHTIPKPRPFSLKLLKEAGVILPEGLPMINTVVDTRKKLVSERI